MDDTSPKLGLTDLEIEARRETRILTISSNFLIVANVVTFLLGLAIAGGATYIWTSNSIASGISLGAIVFAAVLGAFIFLLSFFGIYGAAKQNKVFLIAYIIFVILILSLEIAATVLLAQYLGVINSVSTSNGDGSSITGATSAALNDFLYLVYTKCCFDNKSYCPGLLPEEANYCYPVYPASSCPSENDSNTTVACFTGKSQVAAGNEICLALSGSGLLGKAEPGQKACGGGLPVTFRTELSSLISTNINYLFYAVGVTCFVEFLTIIFAILLIKFKKSSVEKVMLDRDNQLADFAIINPLQTQAFNMEDQIVGSHISHVNSHTSIASSGSSRTAQSEGRPMSMRPKSLHPGVAAARGENIPRRIVSVSIGRGQSVDVDEESGLQVAKPVEEGS